MKIQCDTCSTMYSIADDAVADGMYRVRCKRCPNIITIHGPSLVHNLATTSHEPSFDPPKLRAQRNENSLLFSVNDLSDPSPPHSHRVENSGLLDIRRMATAYKEEPQPRAGEEFASITPVGQVLPHLVAPPARDSRPRHLMWAFGALASVIAAAALVVAFVVVKNQERAAKPGNGLTSERASPQSVVASRDPKPVNPDLLTRSSTEQATEEPSAKESTTTESVKESSATEKAAREPSTKERSVKETAVREPSARNKKRSTEKAHAERTQTSTESSPEQKAGPARCLDEVACLLAEDPPACCSRYKTSTNARSEDDDHDEPRANIPERPSRSAITTSMSKLGGLVTSCGTRYPASGQVTLSIKVDESGDVARVSVKDSPNPALGQCVAKAARKASFPESRRGITFSYPFLFR